MPSPFEILRIDPDADDEEISRAYRRRVKEAHPDQGGSVREFQMVQTAYEDLRSGDRSDWEDADTEPAPERSTGPPEADTRTQVEYLNYEVLDDHGWDLDDDDLFEKAARARLDEDDHGWFDVESGETLLEAAEDRGFSWPYSCRGGACANCAVAVVEGELELSVDHVLPPELTEQGILLSCIGTPTTPEMKVVYNVKHLPELEDLWLPPRPN
ncbi:ferredoxin Fer [Haloarchaeobius sp. HRN-SO-5]|uniref:ferredoxin Fer n=1 Tax=Haloarchaeobius sp. HRN-SO-5 TaxID=3446118 RepID=UPI003EB99C97